MSLTFRSAGPGLVVLPCGREGGAAFPPFVLVWAVKRSSRGLGYCPREVGESARAPMCACGARVVTGSIYLQSVVQI